MSGKSINKIAQELADYMNVGIYNAVRLVRTEVNHFANETEMLAYEELDIGKYRFIATLDNRTCEHCAELDNKLFNVKDRKAGKNYPPLHANDRCTTVAEFNDDTIDGLQRRARDENGKPILVPQDMTYKEWHEKYVTNTENSSIIDKNTTNKEKEMNYQDITKQYATKKKCIISKQKYFIDEYGNKYNVDGKHVVLQPSQREIEVAQLLGQAIGGNVSIIPKVNQPFGIKTPDYIINGERFDLKQIIGGGKYTIQGNLKGKEKQSNNFIIDISNAKFDVKEAERQIENIYNSKHYLWLNKILLLKEKEIIKAYKRYKK